MLLGFLRSAAVFLTKGHEPVAHSKRKRLSYDEDEDCADNMHDARDGEYNSRGTILITLRNVKPYTEWELPKLAKNPPALHPKNPKYTILRSFVFPREEWGRLGYSHRMTKGYAERTGTGVDRARISGKDAGEDRCWEMYLS